MCPPEQTGGDGTPPLQHLVTKIIVGTGLTDGPRKTKKWGAISTPTNLFYYKCKPFVKKNFLNAQKFCFFYKNKYLSFNILPIEKPQNICYNVITENKRRYGPMKM